MPRKVSRALPALLALLLLASSPAWAAPVHQEKQVQELVNEAAALIMAQGEAAFPQFNQPESRWLGQGRSVFIFDETGLELVSNVSPELVGKYFLDKQDDRGRYPAREELALAKSQGSGWLDLRWAKPGEARESDCRVFVQAVTVGGRLLVVGSCYYPD